MTGGREVESAGGAPAAAEAPVALSVEELSGDGLSEVAFELRRGEILGVAGLADARRGQADARCSSAARAA